MSEQAVSEKAKAAAIERLDGRYPYTLSALPLSTRAIVEHALDAALPELEAEWRARLLVQVAEAFETRPSNEAMLCSEVAAYCREQAAQPHSGQPGDQDG